MANFQVKVEVGDVGVKGKLLPYKGIDFQETRVIPGGVPPPGKGKVWLKDDTPSALYFTDDAGTDHELSGVPATETLATTLATGNASGGTDILLTAGDSIVSTGGAPVDVSSSGLVTIFAAATSGESTIVHTGGNGSDLTVGSALGSLNLEAGENIADAVRIAAISASGGIRLIPGTAGRIQLGDQSSTGGALVTPSITSSTGPGAVSVMGMIHEITTTGAANALTIGTAFSGQRVTIIYVAEAAGGDSAELSPAPLAGAFTKITFSKIGDSAELLYATNGWYLLGGSAVAS